jgi:hypothetical protein
MVQDVIPLLPQNLYTSQVALLVIVLLVGTLLWLFGGVWSRGIVTLLAVAIGGLLGMHLPRAYLWPVNSMSIAVLGAVALGVFAYAIPRLWVGLVLGTVLCAWALLGTWITMRGDGRFEERAQWQVETMQWPAYVQDLNARFPDAVRRVVPYSLATAMISGLAFTLLWPRFGRTFMGSTVGVTLVFLAGLTLIADRQPLFLSYIPSQWQAQVGTLVGFVLLGALIQWQLLPGKHETNHPNEQEPQQSLQPQGR